MRKHGLLDPEQNIVLETLNVPLRLAPVTDPCLETEFAPRLFGFHASQGLQPPRFFFYRFLCRTQMAFFRQSQATTEEGLPCSSAHSLASGDGLVTEYRVFPFAVYGVHGAVGYRVDNLALFVSRICEENIARRPRLPPRSDMHAYAPKL